MGDAEVRKRRIWWYDSAPYAPLLLIIVALALFLWPTVPYYLMRKESARRATCISNMKSLALCTLTYAQDWDGRLPPRPARHLHRALAEGGGLGVDGTDLFPPDDWHRQIRCRNDQVFVCPSARSIHSYDFNGRVYGGQLSKLEAGNTVMEFEKGFFAGAPPGPHHQGYNLTFCDGHAK